MIYAFVKVAINYKVMGCTRTGASLPTTGPYGGVAWSGDGALNHYFSVHTIVVNAAPYCTYLFGAVQRLQTVAHLLAALRKGLDDEGVEGPFRKYHRSLAGSKQREGD